MQQSVSVPANLVTVNDFDSDGDMDVIAGLDDDGDAGSGQILLNSGLADPTTADSWVANYEVFDLAPGIPSGSDNPGVGNGTSFDFDRNTYPDVLVGWVPAPPCDDAWDCATTSIGLVRNLTDNPCGQNAVCDENVCVACAPQCGGKQCGPDGCGGSCGGCGLGQACSEATGQCVARNECEPQCSAGDECGSNGCGGVCGFCGPGGGCIEQPSGDRTCATSCTPACGSKPCGGDDGCGGQCAVFGAVETIDTVQNQSRSLTGPTNAPPTTPQVRILPQNPTELDALNCAISGGLYDLDITRVEYRWYRNDVLRQGCGRSLAGEVVTDAKRTGMALRSPRDRRHRMVTTR